jgi:hypothetical protein
VEKRWSVAQIEQRVREMSGIGQTEISREAFAKITWKIIWPCDLAIGSREIIDSEFCALLRSSLFHHRCRFVSFSLGGFSVGEGVFLPRPRIPVVHGKAPQECADRTLPARSGILYRPAIEGPRCPPPPTSSKRAPEVTPN